MVEIKRAYELTQPTDGARVLVDRLWPRGLKKQDAHVIQWMRELGPSNELRHFFGHDPRRWEEFQKRYRSELRRPEARRMLDELARIAQRGRLTLVYSAKDAEHNQAVVLKALLDSILGRRNRMDT
jgi:uncharacterized protein YeaO (DUF488 family)